MALCITRSLAEMEDFDRADIADQVHEWYESDSFDIGQMTADAIREYLNETSWRDIEREVCQHRVESSNAGNGSVR